MLLLNLFRIFIVVILGIVVYGFLDEKETEKDKKQNESDKFYFKLIVVGVLVIILFDTIGALL